MKTRTQLHKEIADLAKENVELKEAIDDLQEEYDALEEYHEEIFAESIEDGELLKELFSEFNPSKLDPWKSLKDRMDIVEALNKLNETR